MLYLLHNNINRLLKQHRYLSTVFWCFMYRYAVFQAGACLCCYLCRRYNTHSINQSFAITDYAMVMCRSHTLLLEGQNSPNPLSFNVTMHVLLSANRIRIVNLVILFSLPEKPLRESMCALVSCFKIF